METILVNDDFDGDVELWIYRVDCKDPKYYKPIRELVVLSINKVPVPIDVDDFSNYALVIKKCRRVIPEGSLPIQLFALHQSDWVESLPRLFKKCLVSVDPQRLINRLGQGAQITPDTVICIVPSAEDVDARGFDFEWWLRHASSEKHQFSFIGNCVVIRDGSLAWFVRDFVRGGCCDGQ